MVRAAREENLKIRTLQAQQPTSQEEIERQVAAVKTSLADLLSAQNDKRTASAARGAAFAQLESAEKEILLARKTREAKMEDIASQHHVGITSHLSTVEDDRSKLANTHWATATSSVTSLSEAVGDLKENSRTALESVSALVSTIQDKLKGLSTVASPIAQGAGTLDDVSNVETDDMGDMDGILDSLTAIGPTSATEIADTSTSSSEKDEDSNMLSSTDARDAM